MKPQQPFTFVTNREQDYDLDEERGLIDKAISQIPNIKKVKIKFNLPPEAIMMRLDKFKMKRMKQIWDENEEGLDLHQFVKLMYNEIHCAEEEKLELLYGSINMFSDVDINGDGNMSWNEFVQCIVNQVESQTVKPRIDKEANREISIEEQLVIRDLTKINRFQHEGDLHDLTRHRKWITCAIHCEGVNFSYVVCVLERSPIIQIFNTKLRVVWESTIRSKIPGSFITHAAYLEMGAGTEHLGPVGTEGIFGFTVSDAHLHLYVKTRTTFRYWKSINTKQVMQKIWYLSDLNLWATAGSDFKLYLWKINQNMQTDNVQYGKGLSLHSDQITDCVEIREPRCICTCSMDRSIVMYDVNQGYVIRAIPLAHDNSIKKMTYIKDWGGYLVTVSFDMNAKVWQPSNIYGEALVGKLKGHNNSLVSVGNFPGQPYVVTVDLINTIIVWDVRNQKAVQTITMKQQNECQGLVVLSKNCFWTFNLRFASFRNMDSVQIRKQIKNVSDPDQLSAYYNDFFDLICVSDGQDIYLYNSETGKAAAIHENIFGDLKINTLNFVLDKGARKAYVSSNTGQFKVLNIQNGVTLADIIMENQDNQLNQISDEIEEVQVFEESDTDQLSESNAEKEVKPMVNIQLEETEHLKQIITGDRDSYLIFDDRDETPYLLRRVTGAHTVDICIVRLSIHLSLVVTGSLDGELAVWDFESSQLQSFLFCHTDVVTCLEFLEPRPLLLSAGLDARVCIWTVRPAYFKQRYICIYQFINRTVQVENQSVRCSIHCSAVIQGGKQIAQQAYKIPSKDLLPAETYRNFKANLVLSRFERKIIFEDNGKYRGPNAVRRIRKEIFEKYYQEKDADGLSYVDKEFQNNLDRQPIKRFRRPSNVKDIESVYFYFGDDAGYIKVWDLSFLLHQCEFPVEVPFIETDLQYYPNRKEKIDVSAYANSIREQSLQVDPLTIEELDPQQTGLTLMECLAHNGPIKHISYNAMRGMFTSCEMDRKVKVWDPFSMDLQGVINQKTLKPDKMWFKKKCELQKKQDDLNKMSQILETLQIPVEVELDSEAQSNNSDEQIDQKKIKEKPNPPRATIDTSTIQVKSFKDDQVLGKLERLINAQHKTIQTAKESDNNFDKKQFIGKAADLQKDLKTLEPSNSTQRFQSIESRNQQEPHYQAKELISERRASHSVLEKLKSINQTVTLLKIANQSVGKSKRSSSSLMQNKQQLISLKNIPTLRDKISYLQPNFSRLRKDVYDNIQFKDNDNEIQSNYESLPLINTRRTLPIPIEHNRSTLSTKRESDYYNNNTNNQSQFTQRESSVKMLHRDISQIQVQSALSQRSISIDSNYNSKQIKLQKKLQDYQNIREKYLGEDSRMSQILSQARLQQAEHKLKLRNQNF